MSTENTTTARGMTTSETTNKLTVFSGKLRDISLTAGAISDLCHFYREAKFLNQEEAFLHIENLTKRIQADALDAMEEADDMARD